MPTANEAAHGLSVTDRAVFRDGVGWVPVSGELHFSRLPRARWAERLRQLRAAGITLASTYVFWNHHSSTPGEARFDGNLDVAAFVDEVEAAGLQLILRIGPWCHGEARNGGFPDWVQDANVAHRTDDPAYLDLVAEWFGQLGAALNGRAQPGGPIIGIQLENELYDRPEHLLTLKRLARENGMSAPLWTATAWGGAELPDGDFFPLFSGYADGFWADPEQEWDPSFRAHYFFSHEWDDPGVGADVRAAQGFAADSGTGSGETATDLHGFPPATCELGSGMATAYHRRPVLDADDIAALANVTIGNGSAWQGYFMYVGGVNPGPGLQETQATGYPNDLPELGYDFHAPIGQSGDLHPSAARLRVQHAFLSAFGDRLASMTSTLPDAVPAGFDDRSTLRWALRSDGTQGVIVISQHQPYERLDAVLDAELRITLEEEEIALPAVDIPAGTIARWPVAWNFAGARIDWATASLLTELPGGGGDASTLVLVAERDIAPVISIDGIVHTVVPGTPIAAGSGYVVVLDARDADHLWVRESDTERMLLRTAAALSWGAGDLRVRGSAPVEVYDPAARGWRELTRRNAASASAISGADAENGRGSSDAATAVNLTAVRTATPVPEAYGFGGSRHRAPVRDDIDQHAAVFRLDVPSEATDPTLDAVLDIDWAGDVAELRVDGRPVDDRFWDGERWSISIVDAGITPTSEVTVHLVPLPVSTTIALPSRARACLELADQQLGVIDAITIRTRGAWGAVN